MSFSLAVHSPGAIAAAESDAFLSRDTGSVAGDRRMNFTAENFLMSFSMPNVRFHATTTYDLLRWKGVTLGKRNFMG